VNINFFWATVDRADSQFFNHGIFILIPTYSFEGYARFMSLCEEPGIMGTICFFFLATLDYHKNKKQFFVLLLAGLISFSLGFYVLIGLWALTQGRKLGMSNIALGAISVVLMLTLFGAFFQERIVERVTGVDIESIDNRTNAEVDAKLNEISKDYRLFLGMGNRQFYKWESKVEGVSAGVKNFVLQYGLVCLAILIISFSSLIINIRGKSKSSWIIILFVWISFYKSNTWNYSPILISLLTVPIATSALDSSTKKNKRQLIVQFHNET
jgi:chromate transport protein ChrA